MLEKLKISNLLAVFFISFVTTSFSSPFQEQSETTEFQCENIIEIASDLRDQKEYLKALEELEIAEDCIHQTQENFIYNLAHILQIRSQVLISLNQVDSARLVSYDAIDLIQDAGYDSLLARIYNGLGNCYWYINSFDSALKYYRFALNKSFLYNQGNNLESSSYYQNIGLVNIYKGDYEQAEDYLLKSIEVKKRILGEDDPSLARNYMNLGVLFSSMSKLDKAFIYYDQAEDLYVQDFSQYQNELGNLYWNKGNGYITVGDYENAEYYLNKALSTFQEDPRTPKENISSVLMNLGFVYEKTDRTRKAVQLYNEALSEEITPSRIKTLRNLALLYSRQNEYLKAEEYYKRSISDALLLFGDYSQDLGLSYLYYGEALINAGNAKDGLNYLDKALEVFRKIFGEYNRDVSTTLIKLGDYYLDISEYDTALKYYQKSISSIIRDTLSETDPLINPEKELIPPDLIALEAFSKKANTFYLIGSSRNSSEYLDHSLNTYSLVVDMIDQLKDLYTTEESKLILSNKAKDAYNSMILVAIDMFMSSNDSTYLSLAFNLSERSKSSVLLASLNEVEAKIKGQIPDDLLSQERSIRENLGTYNRLLYEENQKRTPSQGKLNLWRNKVFELKTKHDSLIDYFEKEYASYYNLKYERSYVDLYDITKNLQEDLAVVDYVVMDTVYYAFVINSGKVHLFDGVIDSSIFNNSIREIIASSRHFAPVNFDTSGYKNLVLSSFYLYSVLFSNMKEVIKQKRVLIIPDGALNYLPFDLLISETTHDFSRIDFKNAAFLLKEYSFSYSSSATLFFKQADSKHINNNKVLAIAPSYDTYNAGSEATEDTIRASLLPLYYTQSEVESILSTFSGRSYLGESATEKVFFDKASSYDIIHLAMHTIINDADPMYSKLVFYPDTTIEFDGYLNTYEIYNLGLDGQLAVLSACNTGFGKLEKGEGVMNMARAFMFAGIPGVVMTLWTVEDKSGAQIMDYFYQNLSEGDPRDIALHRAKLRYLENASDLFSHPYYWAAYVNMGSISPIKNQPKFHALRISLYITLGIIILLLIYWLSNRKKKGHNTEIR